MSSTMPPPERSQEVRIGLVMYGGVSLAVYINGVAQEFYNAVQGNGVYQLIKELTDSDIVLDIVSGSSAGGINGILLSYALANGRDFTRCSELWRHSADIRKLIRSPFRERTATRSLLDSEGYYQSELEHAFRTLDASAASGDAPSTIRELDLFITGTSVSGNTYSRVDDAGHAIAVKDHRAVFQLKHRAGRKSNFDASRNPAVLTALSKLARITSCFPGAFAPVYVPCARPPRRDPDRMSANELLQYWGKLETDGYYIDGGVIDNKPFTHTIREIFFRTTERKVDRKLYYVEPDVEKFSTASEEAGSPTEPPGFLKPIVSSLVSIPGYESIADDLKVLTRRNEDLHQYRRVVRDVGAVVANAPGADPGVDVPSGLAEPLRSIYARSRFASLSEPILAGVFRNATFENSPRLSQHRAAFVEEFDRRTALNPQTLRDYDVQFRLRRVFHLIYYLYELLYRSPDDTLSSGQRARYSELFKALNRQLELLDVLASAMSRLVEETDYGWSDQGEDRSGEICKRVEASLRRLLHAEGLQQHLTDLSALNRTLRQRIDNLKQSSFDVENFRSILLSADDMERELLPRFLQPEESPFQRYHSFNSIDAHVYPIEWISGLREKDVVDTFRVSPADAQRGFSRRPAAEKISGDALAHFSAFFKRTWRSNDILWGRMDGVCQLIETLLTGEKLLDAMSRRNARERARAALLPPEGMSPLDVWFKDSSPDAIERIKNWAAAITSDSDTERAEAARAFSEGGSAAHPDVRDLLIEMSQFRILHETLPLIFEDSIKDQVEWKRSRKRPTAGEDRPLQWTGTDVSVDHTALEAIARIGGKQLLTQLDGERTAELWPSRSRLGQTFAAFRSGSEEVFSGGVPPLILAEIASKSLLVLRTCLLGSMRKSTADRIRASVGYRWAIDIPLRAIYGGVRFLAAAPDMKIPVVVTLTALSLFALFVGISWRDSVVAPGGSVSLLWLMVFIVIPTTILIAEAYQFSRIRLSRTSIPARVQSALTLVMGLAPAFSVGMLYFGLTDTVRDWLSGEPLPQDTPAYMNYVMILLYGIIPFFLSFLGGYLAIREQSQKRMSPENLKDTLERLTDAELQDVADRMGHRFAVKPDTRQDIAAALVSKAEEDRKLGALELAIRASGIDL
jgi:predicted acylesterase/phospholipase RssA